MTRSCGSCTLCCKLVPVVSMQKKANTKCKHQTSKGCGIYADRPIDCRSWSCEWLDNPDVARLRIPRPDYTGYVIDPLRDTANKTDNKTGVVTQIEIMQVWIDPDRPDAWREQRLMDYIDHMARAKGIVTLLRFGSKTASAIFAPSVSDNGTWVVMPPQPTNPAIGRFSRMPQELQDAIYSDDD